MKLILVFLFLMTVEAWGQTSEPKPLKKCLYINSYHKGYEWSDGIEMAAYDGLKDICSLQSFYMDTKINDTVDFAKAKGDEAKAWIDSQKPDLVIVADDAAVEYVLLRHFKNSSLPFVFCGINWEANKYGLPFKNATGMIEVSPVDSLTKQIKEIVPSTKEVVFLSGDVSTDHANYEAYTKIFRKAKIHLKPVFVTTMKEWEDKYKESQKSDVVLLVNYVGIKGWSFDAARQIVQKDTKKFSVTFHEFMRPLVSFSVTKIPAEQGEWAAKVAIEVLNGSAPSSIPVAVNRRSNLYVNDEIAQMAHVKIPDAISRKANKVAL